MDKEFVKLWATTAFAMICVISAVSLIIAVIIHLFGAFAFPILMALVLITGCSYLIATVLYDTRSR